MNVFKTSHPFSAILGTFTGVLIAWKFNLPDDKILQLGIIFLLAQFLTGILNDYVDYDADIKFQPLKITSRGGISKDEIEPIIVISALLLVLVTFVLLPWDIGFVIILGTIFAQAYNIRLKDTPTSGIIFVLAFGTMGISSYIIKFGYDFTQVPYVFIISGLILAIVAHITNDLVDYEIDIKKGSNSMTVFLGRQVSVSIILISLVLLLFLQNFNFVITSLIILLYIVISSGIKADNYKTREIVYYIVGLMSLLILYRIPVN